MKKFVCMIFLAVSLLVTSTSCVLSDFLDTLWENQNRIEPANQIMTKWEAEDFELYITRQGAGLLIWNRDDKEIAYDIELWGNFSTGYYGFLFDRRQQYVDFDYYAEKKVLGDEAYEYQGYLVSFLYYEPVNDTTFLLEFQDASFVTNSLSEKKLRFQRTATGLTSDDVPDIAPSKEYENCPIYFLGSKWISEDNGIVIEMEKEFEFITPIFHRCPIGTITILDSEKTNMQIIFSETDAQAYVGTLSTQDPQTKPYDITQASHIWQCEFYEEYFLATVISSDRYDEGTTIKFIKQTE